MTILRPLGDRVLVKRDEAKDRTESGLFLPSAAKEAPGQGIVVAVGPDVGRDKDGKMPTRNVLQPPLTVDDKVIFTKYAGADVEVEGQTLLLMREDDILAVIETVPNKSDKPKKSKVL